MSTPVAPPKSSVTAPGNVIPATEWSPPLIYDANIDNSMARIRRVDSQKEMEKVIDDFITQGYKIKNQGERSALMKKKNWGSGGMHIVVAVLTIWWTLGLGNVAYAIYKYMTAEEVQIKIEEDLE